MAHIKSVNGLRREVHHVKVVGADDKPTYEPTIVLFTHNRMERSFIIPLSALWKYIEPHNNQDEATAIADREDFAAEIQRANFARRLAVSPQHLAQASADLADCAIGECLAVSMGMLRCTMYRVAKIMRMFDIESNPANAYDIVTLIQDGLDELREFPEHPNNETHGQCGEVTLFQGGKKIGTKPVMVEDEDVYAPAVGK